MKKLVVSLILICITTLSFANPPREYVKIKRNSVYVTAGTFVIYSHAGLLYERYLHYTRNGLITLRAGGGSLLIGANEDTEISSIVGLSYISGEKFNHFEVCFGLYGSYALTQHDLNKTSTDPLNIEKPTMDFISIQPNAFAGYRFQLPNGPLVLRFGVGWPELASASIGYSF